jgi:hypothetical protein
LLKIAIFVWLSKIKQSNTMKNIFKLFGILCVSAVIFDTANAQLIKNTSTLANIEKQLKVQKELAKNREDEFFSILNSKNSNTNADELTAYKFMLAYMPLSDLADYDASYFMENVKYSIKAKNEMPWGSQIPEDIFLHFVLPVRVNNENLDSFRMVVYEELKSRVKNLSMKDAALEVNHWCHEKVTYRGSDARTSSPLASMKYSFGRCGEESTFFVAALRTVGIPARQVYTPRWAHTDDNHAWVEIWADGKWYFLGACEPSPELNMGWFAIPSTRTMLVNTRAFGWYNGSEPTVNREDRFSELNLISNYTPSKQIYVQVFDKNKKAIEKAKVEYQLYNYAEFFPLAKNYTDAKGISSFLTGMGDLMIWANKGSDFAYQKISVKNTDTVKLYLSDKLNSADRVEFEFTPPPEGKPVQANPKNIKENEARLLAEDHIRGEYMKTFLDSAKASEFAVKYKLNSDTTTATLIKSYGNWREIEKFLSEVKDENKAHALKLLTVISEKDLRDTRAEILSDHLNAALKYLPNYSNDYEKWANYVLNGRIGIENMIAWREISDKVKSWKYDDKNAESRIAKMEEKASKAELEKFDYIYNLTLQNIQIDSIANMHSRAPLTPNGVAELKVADPISRDIFFVALSRALGEAARLDPLTGTPQYWLGDNWKTVSFEAKSETGVKKGFVQLKNLSSFDPKYYTNFTLELFQDGVFRSLEFDDVKPISEFAEKTEVPAGRYMLVTGSRKSDGSVLCSTEFFEVKEGETTQVGVKVRDLPKNKEIWHKLNADEFTVKSLSAAEEKSLSKVINGKPFIIAFIEPDKEPSKHIMADLPIVKGDLEDWGGSIIFVLEKGKAPDGFKADQFKNLPKQCEYYWDHNGALIDALEKAKNLDLKSDFPIIIAGDKDGNLSFFTKGYRIGVGEELIKNFK